MSIVCDVFTDKWWLLEEDEIMKEKEPWCRGVSLSTLWIVLCAHHVTTCVCWYGCVSRSSLAPQPTTPWEGEAWWCSDGDASLGKARLLVQHAWRARLLMLACWYVSLPQGMLPPSHGRRPIMRKFHSLFGALFSRSPQNKEREVQYWNKIVNKTKRMRRNVGRHYKEKSH